MIEQLASVSGRGVSRETVDRIHRFADLVRAESENQNLISAASLGRVWDRHILDSAQLVRFEPRDGASWVDIGAGAGFPGMVVATLVSGPVLLIEPRRLRADFLRSAVGTLGLQDRVKVACAKAELVSGAFDVITARAVASLARLLGISTHLSTGNSLWVLPKGRSAKSELAEARRHWHCKATSVPSCTDPNSEILLIRNVEARGGR